MEDFQTSKRNLGMGEKLARVRKLRRFKQEYVAEQLKISQPEYSLLEQQEEIADELLGQIAEILGVPVEFIKTFDDDRVTNNINNVYENEANENEVKEQSIFGAIVGQQFNNNTYNYVVDKRVDELQILLDKTVAALQEATAERDALKKENEGLKNGN